MSPPDCLHLFTADPSVLSHWRHGLFGIMPLQAHTRWPDPEALPRGFGLVDLRLPGLPALDAAEHWPPPAGCRLVAASNQPRDDEGVAALRAGFRGYCNTWLSVDLLPRLHTAINAGELWVGRSLLTRLLIQQSLRPVNADAPDNPIAWRHHLTDREVQVALLVADGASNKVIARELGVTERTVKEHLTHVFSKLHLHDRVQLVLRVRGISA